MNRHAWKRSRLLANDAFLLGYALPYFQVAFRMVAAKLFLVLQYVLFAVPALHDIFDGFSYLWLLTCRNLPTAVNRRILIRQAPSIP